MGEPLSPDRVFDFPEDELELHPPYDFFAPGPLPGYAGNPNNNNGWIEVDVPLLRELGAVADKPMVGLIADEIAEPVDEAEEQVIALVVGMDEDIAMLFGNDDFEDEDFSDDDSEGVEEEEGPSFPLLVPGLPIPPSVIEDLSARLSNLEYGHGQLVKKVIQVSDAEVVAGFSIREIGSRVFAVEGQVQTATQRDKEIARLTRQVQALQATVQQRDTPIQQLQTMVSKTSSRESTLMQCILGLDRQLAEFERRPQDPSSLVSSLF
nr:hypothetical protein [Tanacetum cinerariifolium]